MSPVNPPAKVTRAQVVARVLVPHIEVVIFALGVVLGAILTGVR